MQQIPSKFYFTRLLVGCGNSNCTNTYCKSNPNFQSPEDLIQESKTLSQTQQNICLLKCDKTRFETIHKQTDIPNHKNCLLSLIEEIYSNDETIINCFSNENKFSVQKAFLFADYLFKFAPELHIVTNQCYEKIVNYLKSGNVFPMETILCLLSSPLFTETEQMGELILLLQKNIFQNKFRIFLLKGLKEEFDIILGMLHQFLSLRYIMKYHQTNNTKNDEILFALLQLMKIMYSINEDKGFVDESRFYNEVLPIHRKFSQDIQRFYSNKYPSILFYPFIIPMENKLKFIHNEAKQERDESAMNALTLSLTQGTEQQLNFLIEVRRDHILEDSLNKLITAKATDLKKPLHVKFVGEDGLDHGGVSKEWFQLIAREIFNPENTMFIYNEETRFCWFNSSSTKLNDYKLIGTLFGLAIYNGLIIDAKLPLVVYKKMLGISTQMKDLEEIEPQMLQTFKEILMYEEDDMEDVFCLTFQHTEEINGEMKVVDLKPNGGDIYVNQQNKHEFIQLFVDYILNISVEKQFNAFLSGFKLVFNNKFLSIFSPKELELSIVGSQSFDISELQKVTKYANGLNANSPVVVWLWEILKSYSPELQKKFLFFVTGSERTPPGGLSRLKFTVAKHGDDLHLPSASTCFNLLLLPPYTNKKDLEEKLTFALNNTKGFGLV